MSDRRCRGVSISEENQQNMSKYPHNGLALSKFFDWGSKKQTMGFVNLMLRTATLMLIKTVGETDGE